MEMQTNGTDKLLEMMVGIIMNAGNDSQASNVSNITLHEAKEKTLVVEIIITAILIWIFLTISNLLSIVSFAKSKVSRKTYYIGYYLLELNIISIFVTVVIIPLNVCHFVSSSLIANKVIHVVNKLEDTALNFIMTTCLMMTLERYLCVIDNVHRLCTIDKVKKKIFAGVVWCLSNFIISMLVETCKNEDCKYGHFEMAHCIYFFITIFIIPVSVILYCVAGISRTYSTGSALLEKRRKTHKRFIRRLYVLFLFYYILNLPYHITRFVIRYIGKHQLQANEKILLVQLQEISWLCYLLHPILFYNPFIKETLTVKELKILPTFRQQSISSPLNVGDRRKRLSLFHTLYADQLLNISDENVPQRRRYTENNLNVPAQSSDENRRLSKRLSKRWSLFQGRRRSSSDFLSFTSEDENLFNPYVFDMLIYKISKKWNV